MIFGATGGVMEAALRTAVEELTGETLEKVEFTEVVEIGNQRSGLQRSRNGCESRRCFRTFQCEDYHG